MKVPDIPLRVITHQMKVCSLYKKALRMLMTKNFVSLTEREMHRYDCVMLRQRFEDNRVCSMEQARKILIEGEKEFDGWQNLYNLVFANSYGGLTFERESEPPDWVLDYWHPLEKAQYPEYFARREKRKEEFIKLWNDTHNPDKQLERKPCPEVPKPKKY